MTTVVLPAAPGAVAPLEALVPDLLSATGARQLSRVMFAVLAAGRTADRRLPPQTAALLDGWGLSVAADGGLSRRSDND